MTKIYIDPNTSAHYVGNVMATAVMKTLVYLYFGLMRFAEGLPSLIKFRTKIKNKRVLKSNSEKGLQIGESTIIIEEEKVNEIVTEHNNKEKNEKEEKLKVACDYTERMLAPYITLDDLNLLFTYIKSYSENKKLENIKPIKVKQLSNKDIYRFGWNIWKHFGKFGNKKRNREDIAEFLKKVFEELLLNNSIRTIANNLTSQCDNEIIKLTKNGLSTKGKE